LVKTILEYVCLMALIVLLWHMVAGAALTSIIVNADRIAKEADSYAVKADADVKRSINLANQEFGVTGTALTPSALAMDYTPLLELTDPYVVAPPAATAPGSPMGLTDFQFPTADKVGTALPDVKVVGTGGSGASFFAILSDGHASSIYRVGERIGEWQIIRITDDQVIVAKGDKARALDWKGDR
jgi:hypothetical protein